jgi:hypothetical protein
MITDYPFLKEDEWLFGYLLRYHAYTGNIRFQHTIKDWYNEVFPISFHFIPLSSNIRNIVSDYEDYIRHTIFPYIKIFSNHFLIDIYIKNFSMDGRDRSNELLDRILETSVKYTIRYCPICMDMDFGMFYVEHQIMEVQTCVRHGCYLKSATLSYKDYFYIGQLLKNIDFYSSYPDSKEMFQYVADQAVFILKNYKALNRNTIIETIQNTMVENGMAIRRDSFIKS